MQKSSASFQRHHDRRLRPTSREARSARTTDLALIARALTWLKIPAAEFEKAKRLLALIFCSGAALVFLKAAQSGLFLGAFPSSSIPQAFAVSAVVLATLSTIQVAILPRVGPLKLAVGTLLGGALVLLGLFAAIVLLPALSPASPIVFTLYVVIEALSGLLIMQMWTVVSGALDPRAAKRLLPLCGLASSLAWTVGGLLVGPLAGWLGAPALLVVGAAFLVLTATWVQRVARFDYQGQVLRTRTRTRLWQSWLAGLGFVRRIPLLRLIAALSVLSLLCEQLMDFALMSAAKEQYADPDRLASFFGLFYSGTSALSMGVLLLASSRVLQRFGASRALLAMPLAVLVFGTAAAVVPTLLPTLLMRGAARVLKQAFWGTSLEQTQTPLPVARRAQAKALIRGVLAPLFYALLAGTLASLPMRPTPGLLAGSAAGVAALMLVLIARFVRRAYLQALHRALDGRRLNLDRTSARGGFENLDADTLVAMTVELRSGDAGRATLATEVIGARLEALSASHEALGDQKSILPLLQEASAHAFFEVRRASLRALAHLNTGASADVIAERLIEERSPELKVLAAQSLRHLPWSEKTKASIQAATVDPNPAVRAACRVARFERNETSLTTLLRLLDDDECRIAAMAAIPLPLSDEAAVQSRLQTFLVSTNPLVRIAAMRAIRRLVLLPLLPDAVRLLEDPQCAVIAATELSSWGPAALDVLARISRFAGGESDGSFFKMARAKWAERAYPVLIQLLAHREPTVRQGAGRVLCGLVGTHDVGPLLRLEVDRIFHSYGALAGLAFCDGQPDWKVDGAFVSLADEIELHIAQARARVLQLLYLLNEDLVVRAVEVGLRHPTPRLAAQMAEILELSLERSLAKKIVPLFDSLTLQERIGAARSLGALDEKALTDPLGAVVELGDPHLRRVAMLLYQGEFQDRYPQHFEHDQALLALYDRMRFLRSVPLFAALTGEDLRSVAEIVQPVDVDEGEQIFAEGDPGENLFLVLEGTVAIERSGREVALLVEKDVLGELAVLDKEPRSADAIARSAVRLLRLRAVDLEELMVRRPHIQSAFIQVLVQRLRSTLKES